ncbi:MAG: N-acetyl-gamma-glutamyl-phosphate reductase [Gemmatimonadota bacterium]
MNNKDKRANSSRKPTAGVVGATGYTGQELIGILRGHEDVEVAFATSRSEAGEESAIAGLRFSDPEDVDPEAVDVLFLCLPHGLSAPWVERLRGRDVRIIDLTADHRPGSGREEGVVYGLSERNAEAIATADVVANPGCYPTGVILGLAPLLEAGLVDTARRTIVNAASGVTGAGRSPKKQLLFAEVSGDFKPYGLGNTHRHLREMKATLPGMPLIFQPHLLPVPRGILETIYVPVPKDVTAERVRATWSDAYRTSPGIRAGRAGAVSLAEVVGSDRVVLEVSENEGEGPNVLTVMVALDNLGKGAAGQAVQNMNLMLNFPEGRGLRC